MDEFFKNSHRYLLVAVIAAAVLSFSAHLYLRGDGTLAIYFLDVGQGDAIYLRSSGGRDMLIDGGPSRTVIRRLGEVMPFFDRELDVIIATHPDADHIGGLPDTVRRFGVGAFLEPGVKSQNAYDDILHDFLKKKGIDIFLARRGMKIYLDSETYFEILSPDRSIKDTDDTNRSSIVGRVVYGETSAIFMGDSPKSVENRLLSEGLMVKSDVLKAGHHGSNTSSGDRFVSAVSPRFSVISSGSGNRYGHPHAQVLDVLERAGTKVLRTDRSGTIGLYSDGIDFREIKKR